MSTPSQAAQIAAERINAIWCFDVSLHRVALIVDEANGEERDRLRKRAEQAETDLALKQAKLVASLDRELRAHNQVSALREVLVKAFHYTGSDIENLELKESAQCGAQALNRQIAVILDGTASNGKAAT